MGSLYPFIREVSQENTPSEDDVSLRRVKLKFELLREFKHELTKIINNQLMEK